MPTTPSQPQPTAYEFEPYELLDGAELTARIQAVRRDWGKRLLILGYHCQQDKVIDVDSRDKE